jgi:hypothetical protein
VTAGARSVVERVVIVGNGLSIAASSEFKMKRLTELVRIELGRTKRGERTVLELLELAGKHLVPDQATYKPDENFEHLLGPLDRLGDLLSGPLLTVLSDVTEDLGLSKRVGDAAKDLYTRAVASVLKVIDSIAADHDVVRKTVDWCLADVVATDVASIFTLNYDPLLDSWVLDASKRQGCPWGLRFTKPR